jgi:uncharacterized protein (DUF983 family)
LHLNGNNLALRDKKSSKKDFLSRKARQITCYLCAVNKRTILMSQKKSLFYSLINAKCPRCREGNMFPKETLYTLKFADMHPHCLRCGLDLEQETGYYYGAMYVSFGFNVGIFLVSFFILSQFVEEISLTMMAGVVFATTVGCLPIIFRLSRAIWIHIFIRYEGASSQIPQIPHKIQG